MTTTGFDQALKAIREGKATASALWVLLSDERDRDGFGLKPSPWEGPGEYQRVSFGSDALGVLVKVPSGRHLPIAKPAA